MYKNSNENDFDCKELALNQTLCHQIKKLTAEEKIVVLEIVKMFLKIDL